MSLALASGFALGVALACSSAATADPTAEPLPPSAEIGDAIAQSGSVGTGPFGLPDLSAYGPNLLLAQNPVPSAPGTAAPAITPNLNAFNNQYLLPQNLTPVAPGESSQTGSDQDPPSTRLGYLKQLYDIYQAGGLKGALLG